jgi:hypothetical protein
MHYVRKTDGHSNGFAFQYNHKFEIKT